MRRRYRSTLERFVRPGLTVRPDFRLMVSATADRVSATDSVPLAGSSLTGDAYVFVTDGGMRADIDTGITQVVWYLDGATDPGQGFNGWTQSASTWDFNGTSPSDEGTVSYPWDTSQAANGTHRVRADITYLGRVYTVEAAFTVTNTGTGGSTFTNITNIAAFPVGNDATVGVFGEHEAATDRFSITTLSGEKVFRSRCAVGDNNIANSGTGERCEMYINEFTPSTYWNDYTLRFRTTDSYVFGQQFYLDPTFASSGFLYGTNYESWNNFIQNHHSNSIGQAPFQLNLCTDSARLGMRLIGYGGSSWNTAWNTHTIGATYRWCWTPAMSGDTVYTVTNNGFSFSQNGTGGLTGATSQVSKGTWHTLIWSVKYSPSSSNGYAKVWLDGTQVFNVTGVQLGYAQDTGAYHKWGFYRSGYSGGDSTIYWRDLLKFPTETDALTYFGY